MAIRVATELFRIGDVVPESGTYICVPCGYTQTFYAGELFTTCLACFAGTANGPEGFTEEDAEFWQYVG
ncbi:MAG: hypothetical protein A3I44_06125 [Candidatus Sungbacteria bacterium RIFCSPLOWO2_02_FULL_51_17]|uniref:Uncharacterized protein n=1 Tax=Candidatus Sungbacteria bacterium RIFCSPHIGHO2_02_FULL_51_29 TaxID=1802273 RepID=A0A1G2KZI9_9BACT|nr:MAG: hypothetical protein A2676_04440 [Candidatus Sungbacteria bacterium RIFCSPHIGHO2_01_FULL_51_22]OHA03849.1 MAG: hypothetical protein A3C16_05185 [Candidatus Sungbacteria bacterium RIFCSPHIGHO2_02_FULL_51_29]OHA06202.1 MAG: hypothetical protein A3B29_05690 [Candidatus Sungbacteria bacterium RIFCSPLOWO2_01_FULL_51_34]OHA10354.1 MAG: hypothetical protein A3I44_06125 [Candidatus Sungbacteria bacterium RIFCSPLOWO2_02_FULL_51_17]